MLKIDATVPASIRNSQAWSSDQNGRGIKRRLEATHPFSVYTGQNASFHLTNKVGTSLWTDGVARCKISSHEPHRSQRDLVDELLDYRLNDMSDIGRTHSNLQSLKFFLVTFIWFSGLLQIDRVRDNVESLTMLFAARTETVGHGKIRIYWSIQYRIWHCLKHL